MPPFWHQLGIIVYIDQSFMKRHVPTDYFCNIIVREEVKADTFCRFVMLWSHFTQRFGRTVWFCCFSPRVPQRARIVPEHGIVRCDVYVVFVPLHSFSGKRQKDFNWTLFNEY